MKRDYDILVEPGKGVVVKGWTRGILHDSECEVGQLPANTIDQLTQMAKMPFVFPYIAVMPDAHWGMGSCVGSVIPTKNAIMPATVGVDIGCGMIAHKLNMKRDDFDGLEDKVRTAIMHSIPTGRTQNGGDRDIGGWQGFPYLRGEIPDLVGDIWDIDLGDGYEELMEGRHGKALRKARTIEHLGSLGTGNHFIELSSDENNDVWIVIHSGSRGIGARIGGYFTKLAQEKCSDWYSPLPDKNLAFFPKGSREYDEYWHALQWAQKYAWKNREIMMDITIAAVQDTLEDYDIGDVDRVHCHHNYAAIENHFGKNVIVTRKGAIRARSGDRGIIPGDMGRQSFITRGKENKDALHSSSHGAGRTMSRNQAKKEISVEEHIQNTKGVFCDKTLAVIDESSGAYKDIKDVMAAQEDLIEIEHKLKSFINVKGLGEEKRRRKKS